MTLTVTCSCGKTAVVPPHFAGRTGRCNGCGAAVSVPFPGTSGVPPAPAAPPPIDSSQPSVQKLGSAAPAAKAEPRPLDPAFDRDLFLLRQKHLSINEKYTVWDDQGDALLFVERPSHLWRNLLAIFAGIAAGSAIFLLTAFTAPLLPEAIRLPFGFLGFIGGFAAIFVVYIWLEQKRHVEFYRNEGRGEKLLRVMQDAKVQLLNATYTVTDGSGSTIGTFSKNYLWDIIFKRWECRSPHGHLLFKVREDSMVKALLRRLLGPLLGILRLDFVFTDPASGAEIGRFNRSFTLLDRYVLDMSDDHGRGIDRRLALAMGVMLDTGERR